MKKTILLQIVLTLLFAQTVSSQTPMSLLYDPTLPNKQVTVPSNVTKKILTYALNSGVISQSCNINIFLRGSQWVGVATGSFTRTKSKQKAYLLRHEIGNACFGETFHNPVTLAILENDVVIRFAFIINDEPFYYISPIAFYGVKDVYQDNLSELGIVWDGSIKAAKWQNLSLLGFSENKLQQLGTLEVGHQEFNGANDNYFMYVQKAPKPIFVKMRVGKNSPPILANTTSMDLTIKQ